VKGWAYHVYLVDPAIEHIPIEHIFYGRTKAECTERFRAHQGVCGSFGPAIAEGRFDDEWEQIDELPTIEDDDEDDDAIELEEE
jgi:hypothetical protein